MIGGCLLKVADHRQSAPYALTGDGTLFRSSAPSRHLAMVLDPEVAIWIGSFEVLSENVSVGVVTE